MIVTVTLNPSLDRAVEVDSLTRGEVIRAATAHLDPGGKGVNVSRALLANGVPSVAVLPSGGDEGNQLIRLLKAEGVEVLAVSISGRTRSNITLAEPDGTVTKINEPGPAMCRAEFDEVIDRVLARASGADWVVLCGSVPPGLPADAYAQLCRKLRAAGVRVAVDTSGPALREAALAGATLLKPNRDELADVVGTPLKDLGDVVDAAQCLRAWGAGTVVASLGADGAVLVDAEGVRTGTCPVARPRSAVGAGDALLAGFLAAGAHGAAALAEGLAWGAAAVSLPGSRMPGPADLHRHDVTIHP
ncbi:1-phosphofructokinase [Micromonospora ureilytica]|uniref:1-phosphofructokinase n=1 Tax=Micromonospora ureilytica TaxID=709868 RepID=A0A3N9XR25_9ACTN|nr:1-phosphofructokinase [Micromonospora ureilytica]RQX15400.1 1-phosphofructokinase [Micromonospora ureilytica]